MSLDKYGHFSEDGREFLITRPDTPAPWVNYISNTRYTGLVTNSGGGYSFYICPKDSRITRHRYNGLPWDRPGRYVYLKDEEDHVWSLSWQPIGNKPDKYLCRHGMGYTAIETEYFGIKGEILYFVPSKDDLEIWRVRLTNNSDHTRKLKTFGYVELCLGHAMVDLINQPNDQHFNRVNFDKENQILLATKNYWVTYTGATVKQPNQAWNKYAFMASSLPIESWDGKKDKFIGPWRSESNPIAIEEGRCTNSEITAGDACGAIQSEITLAPGETKEFVILLGVVDADNYKPLAKSVVEKYRKPEEVQKAFDELKAYWENYLDAAVVETPDSEFNLMMNTWGKRQAWVTFEMHRTAGYYHGGLLFGIGLRDQCQDMMGPLVSEPARVKDRIHEVFTHQFANGSTLHNYFPITGQGERTGHVDTPLWLPLSIMMYIKETGDWDILNEVIPFQDEGESTVLDHIIRAVDYTLTIKTPRNLVKFGPGDWNDTLDYVGRKGIGESIWNTEYLCWILRETADLLERIQKQYPDVSDKAKHYREEYALIAKALNDLCWDGEWYIRGTRDDGGVIGSKSCKEGQIFMNSESWAVISGIAPKDRAEQAMESAYKMLDTPRGPKILTPAYRTLDQGVGLATRCVAGKKENASVFDHVVAWAVLGECHLGHGDRAYDYYRKSMPMIQATDPDIYRMEPYAYAEYVTSPDHETFGEASHSWLTGSAVWFLRDGLDYILGVRPEYKGLRVDPCIPSKWDGFKITRKFRNASYAITVKNPNGVQKGVKSVSVDGKPIEGNILPVFEDGKEHAIEVVMG